MVLVAAFTLRALKKSFFGDSGVDALGGSAAPPGDVSLTSSAERSIQLEPITLAEKLGAGLLIFATVAVGVYPKLLLDRIQPAVEAMRFLK
jgi:NADH:ubiquinone oxidoreductase subunit 4 (subunit M)